MRKGIKRNGAPVRHIMPSSFYEVMTDRDLDTVIAICTRSSRSRMRCRTPSTRWRKDINPAR